MNELLHLLREGFYRSCELVLCIFPILSSPHLLGPHSSPRTLPTVGKFWIGWFRRPRVFQTFPFSIFRNSTSDTAVFLASSPPATTITLSPSRSVCKGKYLDESHWSCLIMFQEDAHVITSLKLLN